MKAMVLAMCTFIIIGSQFTYAKGHSPYPSKTKAIHAKNEKKVDHTVTNQQADSKQDA